MILGFQKTPITEDERFERRRILVCRYRSEVRHESSATVCAVSMYRVFKPTALNTDTSTEYLHERDPSDHQRNRAALHRSTATTACRSQWKADKGNADMKALPMGGFLKVPCVNMWEELIAFCTICFLYNDSFTVGIVPLLCLFFLLRQCLHSFLILWSHCFPSHLHHCDHYCPFFF